MAGETPSSTHVALTETEKELLVEHLPHELNMLETALKIWTRCVDNGDGKNEYCRILAFENFWLHCRNIIEFFYHKGSDQQAGAKRFVTDPNLDFGLSGQAMDQLMVRINAQISHLQLQRGFSARESSDQAPKSALLTGQDAELVFERISRAVSLFGEKLSEEAKDYWKTRQSQSITISPDMRASACSYHSSDTLKSVPEDAFEDGFIVMRR